MATNNIKPFATSSSANVLSDSELAGRSELQTGFPFKSKADSKLVGKLIQNATAGAYALGALTIKYGSTDVSGANAEGFATAFETALTEFVSQKAPPPDLSDYAPLASPALTGTPTLNGVNIATVDDVPEIASKAKQLVSQGGDALATAANKLVQITNGVPVESTATVGSATKPVYVNAGTFTEAGTTLDVSISGTAAKATADAAGNNIASTYTTKTEAQALMPKSGGTFTGAVSVPAPTASAHAATKQYVDSAVASVYKYKGSVANVGALPKSNQVTGDVYNVEDTGDNYAWDGTQWDKLAGTVDLSAYLTSATAASTYLTQTNAASTYLGINAKAASAAAADSAASATKLAAARSFNVNLASTTAASFDGSNNATLGVTGTLPIANGGTGATTAAAARTAIGALATSGGTVSGNLTVTGALSGQTLAATSDLRLKDVKDLVKDVDLSELVVYRYSFKNDKSKENHIGLIAQDVQKVVPEAVKTDAETGYLSIEYNALVAVLVDKVNRLEKRIKELENK